jgi:hypothetical protein
LRVIGTREQGAGMNGNKAGVRQHIEKIDGVAVQFRYNNRENRGIFGTAIGGC